MFTTALKAGIRKVPLRFYGARWSPVLTYHTCYEEIPPTLDPVDNVKPRRLYDQLSELAKHYRFVTVDEYCASRNRRNIAAITFDDGNKSVIENAMPVLLQLGIPFTIFVNTLGIERKTFWRFKVRYIAQHNLTLACEDSFRRVKKLPGLTFLQYTKHWRNSTITVEREIDEFLQTRGLDAGRFDYVFDSSSYFVDHPLISYGNHTANHYVLGSLTSHQQYEEIAKVKDFLAKTPGIQVSDVFAAPFGAEQHITDETFQVLVELGYRRLLVNRGGVNRAIRKRCGIEVIERFSVLDEEITGQLKRHALCVKGAFVPAA